LKKNVILICIDGGRLDRARKSKVLNNIPHSVFFSQTITYAPYTNSAIHALISGSYGHRNGCYSYWHSSRFKNYKFKTLVDYLHDNNYYTYADMPSDLLLPQQSFDEFVIYDENDVDMSKRHTNLLQIMKTKFDKGQNFFLYLHYTAIHTTIKDVVLKVYNNFSKEYFDNRALNEKRYDELFQKAEIYIKDVLDKITELGLWKDSVVLLFSDHGISVGEKFGERAYGAFCYDYTIKTFSYYISTEFKQKEISKQVRHVDFMPTVLDHLGIKIDSNYESLDGESLLPLINENNFVEKHAYSETGNPLHDRAPPKKPNTKSIRTSEWKLIFNEYNCTKELYNLKNDPNEEINLINTGLAIENILWEEIKKIQTHSIIDESSKNLSVRTTNYQ